MSRVTDLILICSLIEDRDGFEREPTNLIKINEFLVKRVDQELKNLKNSFGGGKYPQLFCYGGAINYLGDVEELKTFISSLDWKKREDVVLIYQEEESEKIEYFRLE